MRRGLGPVLVALVASGACSSSGPAGGATGCDALTGKVRSSVAAPDDLTTTGTADGAALSCTWSDGTVTVTLARASPSINTPESVLTGVAPWSGSSSPAGSRLQTHLSTSAVVWISTENVPDGATAWDVDRPASRSGYVAVLDRPLCDGCYPGLVRVEVAGDAGCTSGRKVIALAVALGAPAPVPAR